MPVFVSEANGYYVGQVLPLGHVHELCRITAISRSAVNGPLGTRYVIDWKNDHEGTQGTFVSWK